MSLVMAKQLLHQNRLLGLQSLDFLEDGCGGSQSHKLVEQPGEGNLISDFILASVKEGIRRIEQYILSQICVNIILQRNDFGVA